MSKLFTPVNLGRYTLKNRLVMAPMTRSRANADGTPGELAALYYAQRASIGLIIAEGTQPSEDGQGYLMTPGIYTDAHVAGWKKIADAVHQKGSKLFIQLMHAGRMSHPDNTPITGGESDRLQLHLVLRCLLQQVCRIFPYHVRSVLMKCIRRYRISALRHVVL